MTIDMQAVMQAMARAGEPEGLAKAESEAKPVVTVSRTFGCGGEEIVDALAARLGVDCFDKEILGAIAAEADVSASLMHKLHETEGAAGYGWLYSLFSGKNVTRDDYRHHLVTTIRGLFHVGGIIVGRAGHVILADRNVMRLRLVASFGACVRRIAEGEGIEQAAAEKRVQEINHERERFVWEMFQSRINTPQNFDLVVNTDSLTDPAPLVEFVVAVLTARGFKVPSAA